MPAIGATDPADLAARACAELGFSRQLVWTPMLKSGKVLIKVAAAPVNPSNYYSIGMGIHHSGVEILGREYSFVSGGEGDI